VLPVSTPATDATTLVPPATPTAVMVAMMTRRRPRIHHDDLSFLNHFIQAARDVRIEGIASIGAEVRARPATEATAPHRIPPSNRRRSIAFIGCFLLFRSEASSALTTRQLPNELGSQASVFLL
jgi:hypothetical protein